MAGNAMRSISSSSSTSSDWGSSSCASSPDRRSTTARASNVSVARMKSPGGWIEPGQTPEFDEYTLVVQGMLRVSTANGAVDVHAGEDVIAHAGEWVQYSTPSSEGAEYVAICLPAFGPDIVHRDS